MSERINELENEISLLKQKIDSDRTLFLVVAGIVLAFLGYTNIFAIPSEANDIVAEKMPGAVETAIKDKIGKLDLEKHLIESRRNSELIKGYAKDAKDNAEIIGGILENHKLFKNADGSLYFPGTFVADRLVAEKLLKNKGTTTEFGLQMITDIKSEHFFKAGKNVMTLGIRNNKPWANFGFSTDKAEVLVQGILKSSD